MKKIFDKKIIITFIISGIIFTSIGVYAASLYSAKDISYNKENWEVSNVNDALNDLKNKTDVLMTGDAIESDILIGKKAVVNGKIITGTNEGGSKIINLGTGTSHNYNISTLYPDIYNTLTVDNFLVVTNSCSMAAQRAWGDPSYIGAGNHTSYVNASYSINKTYSNGVFTASASIAGSTSINYNTWPVSGSNSVSTTVYLVIGDID